MILTTMNCRRIDNIQRHLDKMFGESSQHQSQEAEGGESGRLRSKKDKTKAVGLEEEKFGPLCIE